MKKRKSDPEKLLSEFADSKNISRSRIDKPKQFDVGLRIGRLLAVAYQVAPGDNRIHRFRASSQPLLIASADGKNLAIVGGKFRFTNRGIVDK